MSERNKIFKKKKNNNNNEIFVSYSDQRYSDKTWTCFGGIKAWPVGYKTFIVLNSAEHEIYPAKKSQITNNCKFFLPTIAEHENFYANKYENANHC